MPWKEKSVEGLREAFVKAVMAKEESMSSVCRQYAITRTTGYKWLERYKNCEGFSDRSRRPFHTPNRTPPETEAKLLQVREEHPAWGPRKLKRYLENHGETDLPAASTVAEILKRNGCISREESLMHRPYQRFERAESNDLWQADFKGDFLLGNDVRCYPLTVLDDHSRFSLCMDAKENVRKEGVFSSFERLFSEYGLPNTILTDNGNPWGTSQRTGYTLFELWLMKLDILPIHGRPMHLQTQGKEERFHRTMKKELLSQWMPTDMKDAQRGFDAFRKMYNTERPHGALKLDVPAAHYAPSQRKYSKAKPPTYPEGVPTRKVNPAGYFTAANHTYFLSEALAGEHIRLRPEPDVHTLTIFFGDYRIAVIDTDEHLFISKRITRSSPS